MVVGEPGCSFHLQSLGAQGLGVHLQPTPARAACLGKGYPRGSGGGGMAAPNTLTPATPRDTQASLYSHRHTDTPGPIQRLTQTATHTGTLMRTHLHTSTHTLKCRL